MTDTDTFHKPGTEKMMAAAFWAAVAVFALSAFFAPFLKTVSDNDAPWLLWFHDDFFLYVEIVKNTLAGRFSTFDTVTATNGYHPLWMWVLTALGYLADPETKAFFVLVKGVSCLLALGSTFLFVRFSLNVMELSRLSARTGGLFFLFLYVFIAQTGMEAMLLPPILLWAGFLASDYQKEQSPKTAFLLGFVLALAMLARLDAFVFFILIAFCLEESNKHHEFIVYRRYLSFKNLFMIALGLSPLLVFMLWSWFSFGRIIPVSVSVKTLAQGFSFNGHIFEQLFTKPLGHFFRSPVAVVVATLPAVLAFGSASGVIFAFSKDEKPSTWLYAVFALFPVAYYVGLALFMSWSLWEWYLYPLALAGPLCLTRSLDILPELLPDEAKTLLRRSAALVVAFLFVLMAVGHVRQSTLYSGVVRENALKIEAFANDHPGLYAMGENAGLTAYVLSRPLFHMYGLLSDGRFIDVAKAATSVDAVFEAYGVDYYIARGASENDGCYFLLEPKPEDSGVSGISLSKWLCAAPVYAFTDSTGTEIAIFDVSSGEENEK